MYVSFADERMKDLHTVHFLMHLACDTDSDISRPHRYRLWDDELSTNTVLLCLKEPSVKRNNRCEELHSLSEKLILSARVDGLNHSVPKLAVGELLAFVPTAEPGLYIVLSWISASHMVARHHMAPHQSLAACQTG